MSSPVGMDQFAQSRGDDDLFDDEIVPIQRAAQKLPSTTNDIEQPEPAPVPNQTETESNGHDTSTSTNRARNRTRGRAGGNVASRNATKPGLNQSKYATKSSPAPAATPKTSAAKTNDDTSQKVEDKSAVAPAEPVDESAPPVDIPTGPSNPTVPRPPAVKGDRLNTGGVQRPKLTEDELNAKLAAAKERNQSRAAAYAREQADAESFAERERVASVKRAQETADRRVLEGEREKNRERKLRGQGGREWDAKKNESDFAGRGRGDRRRHFNPENDNNDDLSMYEWHEDRGRGRGRGRGARGNRGRGRGDTASFRGAVQKSQPNVNAESDFPSLPGSATKKTNKASEAPTSLDNLDTNPIGSWADQVEAGDAAKT